MPICASSSGEKPQQGGIFPCQLCAASASRRASVEGHGWFPRQPRQRPDDGERGPGEHARTHTQRGECINNNVCKWMRESAEVTEDGTFALAMQPQLIQEKLTFFPPMILFLFSALSRSQSIIHIPSFLFFPPPHPPFLSIRFPFFGHFIVQITRPYLFPLSLAHKCVRHPSPNPGLFTPPPPPPPRPTFSCRRSAWARMRRRTASCG